MDLFEKFYTLSLRYLTRRPRSEKELKDYLKKKFQRIKAEPSEEAFITQKIIDTLKQQKFLNDEEFAKWWIEQRTKFKHSSQFVIKRELLQKGISKEILASCFALDGSKANDLEQAKILVEKKLPRYRNLEKRELYNKLGAFLARRGFDWDTIKKAIDEILGKGV